MSTPAALARWAGNVHASSMLLDTKTKCKNAIFFAKLISSSTFLGIIFHFTNYETIKSCHCKLTVMVIMTWMPWCEWMTLIWMNIFTTTPAIIILASNISADQLQTGNVGFQDTVYFTTWIPSSADLQSTLWFIDDIALINSSSTPSTTHPNRIWQPCFQFSRTSHLEQSSHLSHWSKQSACFPSPTQDTSVHCCFRKQRLIVT